MNQTAKDCDLYDLERDGWRKKLLRKIQIEAVEYIAKRNCIQIATLPRIQVYIMLKRDWGRSVKFLFQLRLETKKFDMVEDIWEI